MNYEQAFQLVDLEVLRLDATKAEATDEHVQWSVGYAPQIIEGADETSRVVLGTLHAGGEDGWATITVGAVYIHQVDSLDDEDLVPAVSEADATETLYDYARSHLAIVLATVGVAVALPRASPDPDVAALVRSSDADPGASGHSES